MPSQSDGGFAPVLPFDVDDPEFARGFEAGRIWGWLTLGPDPVVGIVAHASNAEMLLRMAEAQGRTVKSEGLDETWIRIDFSEVSL